MNNQAQIGIAGVNRRKKNDDNYLAQNPARKMSMKKGTILHIAAGSDNDKKLFNRWNSPAKKG